MSIGQQELSGYPNAVVGGILPRHSRVTYDDDGKAVLAGDDERGVGTVAEKDVAPGLEPVAIRPITDPGVHKMIADGPIPAGAKIVPAINGRVAAAASGDTNIIGVRACSAESYSVVQPGDYVGVFPVFE